VDGEEAVMVCPNCGSDKTWFYGDDPAGVATCGDCGRKFTSEESRKVDFESKILEELKKIGERLSALERKSPDYEYGIGGCRNCGCKELISENTSAGESLRCRACGYKFYAELKGE
jgi:DNA-directed RNA polymerase subunit RPC12/RpoP